VLVVIGLEEGDEAEPTLIVMCHRGIGGRASLAYFLLRYSGRSASNAEQRIKITETWTWRAKGKDTPMMFHFTRKKS
jgi:hypothetical protein